jgi:hypothetical protein
MRTARTMVLNKLSMRFLEFLPPILKYVIKIAKILEEEEYYARVGD